MEFKKVWADFTGKPDFTKPKNLYENLHMTL